MIDINTLRPFMFTANNVQYKDTVKNKRDNGRISKSAIRPTMKLYHPKQRDPLFWCFYIALEGMPHYEEVKSHSFVKEKEFKFSSVELLRTRIDELKSHKLKRYDIEDALVNRPKITIDAFQALCLLYRVSFIYTKGSIYYEFDYGDGDTNVVIVEKGQTRLYTGNDVAHYATNIRNGRWHIEDPAKPIRAISAYTLGELREFCDRLSLEHEGLKKAQLYQKIREKIS